MIDHVIVVDVDGTIYGMWSDDLIGLYEVDKAEVTRASNVEFCNCDTCKGWHVWEPDMSRVMTMVPFETREAALQWEQQEIARRLIERNL